MKLSDIQKHVCLGIDKRIDQHQILIEQFIEHNCVLEIFMAGDGETLPSDKYNRIDTKPPARGGYVAWRNRPNSWNAFQCFRTIINNAKDGGLTTIGIYEDDCELLPNINDVLEKATEQLQRRKLPWDMLYLGANHTFAITEEWGPNLLKLNGSGCWHAVLINNENNNMFQAILDLPQRGPIDQMTGQVLHKKYNCFAVWPTVAIQKPGYSHCEGVNLSYNHYWKNKGQRVIKK